MKLTYLSRLIVLLAMSFSLPVLADAQGDIEAAYLAAESGDIETSRRLLTQAISSIF